MLLRGRIERTVLVGDVVILGPIPENELPTRVPLHGVEDISKELGDAAEPNLASTSRERLVVGAILKLPGEDNITVGVD